MGSKGNISEQLRELKEAVSAGMIGGPILPIGRSPKMEMKRLVGPSEEEGEKGLDLEELVQVAKDALLRGKDPHEAVETALGYEDEKEPVEVVQAVEKALEKVEIKKKEELSEEEAEKEGEPRANEEKGIRRILTGLYDAMTGFIRVADRPLDSMEDLAEQARALAEAPAIRPMDVDRFLKLGERLNRMFGYLYGEYVKARELAYELAGKVGLSTRVPGEKTASKSLEGMGVSELLKDIVRITEGFPVAFRAVQEAGSRVLKLVRETLSGIEAGRTDGVEESKDIVKAFLDLRSSVSQRFYAIWGGVARRINEIAKKFRREEPVLVKEALEVPWETDPEISEFEEACEYSPRYERLSRMESLIQRLRTLVS